MPNTGIIWDGIKSSKRVLEVAEAGLFTLTSNISAQPGVEPLVEEIKTCYGNESKDVFEESRANFHGYVCQTVGANFCSYDGLH